MKDWGETIDEIDGRRLEGPKGKSIDERLRGNPLLRARIESILQIIENEDGAIERADDAEERAMEELRKLGNELLQGWAERQQQRKSQEQRRGDKAVRRQGKKNSTGRRVLDRLR